MVKWNFPEIIGGQLKGVSDAGIENFSGSELTSLVRENCQNSLDAAINDEDPCVRVEFECSHVDSTNVPGINDYREILKKCKDFWDTMNSVKSHEFLRDAYSYLRKDKTFVLRISDYNTAGLSFPYSHGKKPQEYLQGGWYSLVKVDGAANKDGDKAGAFGIGKSAPFCNSAYRVVFYRTLNIDNERAAQGISRLLSYPGKQEKSYTSGIGYYGEENGNDPIGSIPELDSFKKRDECGTDVFIYGFKSTTTWENEAIIALLDNFLMSIYNGMLSVKIQNQVIDKDTLGSVMRRSHRTYVSETKNTYGNYLALTSTSGVTKHYKEFHGLGTLELTILVDPNEKLDRKILVVRKAGMKLFRLSNINKVISFTGILELKGKALNSYFRQMETVAHDCWEPRRYKENPKQAKAYYEEIKEWIHNVVAELVPKNTGDEVNVVGLGDMLQSNQPGNVSSGGVVEENIGERKEKLDDDTTTEIIVKPPSEPKRPKGFIKEKGNSDGKGKKKPGTLGDGGNLLGGRKVGGEKDRIVIHNPPGRTDENGKDTVFEKLNSTSDLNKVRILKHGIGKYYLVFSSPKDINHGMIELVTVGENGRLASISIAGVKAINGCGRAIVSNGYIEFSGITTKDKVKLDIEISDSYDYAMKVNIYENIE